MDTKISNHFWITVYIVAFALISAKIYMAYPQLVGKNFYPRQAHKNSIRPIPFIQNNVESKNISNNKYDFSKPVQISEKLNPYASDLPLNIATDDTGIYLLANTAWLYALDGQGNIRWKYHTGRFFLLGNPGGIQIDEGALYAGFSDGYLMAFNKADGSVLWVTQLDDRIRKPIRLINGRILVMAGAAKSDQERLFIVNAGNGEIQEQSEHIKIPKYTNLIISRENDLVFYWGQNRQTYMQKISTGELLWKRRLKTRPMTAVFTKEFKLIAVSQNRGFIVLDPHRGYFKDTVDSPVPDLAFAKYFPDNQIFLLSSSKGENLIFRTKDKVYQFIKSKYKINSNSFIEWQKDKLLGICDGNKLCSINITAAETKRLSAKHISLVDRVVTYGDYIYFISFKKNLIRQENIAKMNLRTLK